MMKILKKSLVIPTCLTLLTASSQAALVLEFREVGGTQVELSFSGSATITGSFRSDNLNDSPGFVDYLTREGIARGRIGDVNNFEREDRFEGDDLLKNMVLSDTVESNGPSLGLALINGVLVIGSGLDNRISDNGVADVDVLDARSGGNLAGRTQTFGTTLFASRLDRFLGNGPQDLWRVSGTTGDNNLIQFRVNASSVPEPSSILMTGLGLLTLVTRRKRKT